MVGSKKVKIVFITGSSRSGTTLLDRILGQVKNCFSLGEMFYIWERSLVKNQLCGCGKPFRECDFWQTVFKEAFGSINQVNAEEILKLQRSVVKIRYIPQLIFPTLRTRKFRRKLSRYVEILERLYTAIAKVSNSRILIDSSKFAPHGFVLKEMRNFSQFVIQIHRDSRAVAYSFKRKKSRPEIYWEKAYMPAPGTLKAIRVWIVDNCMAYLLGKTTSRYKLLRYEQFTDNPKASIDNIVKWINREKFPKLRFFFNERVVNLEAAHTVSGNPLRFKVGKVEIYPDMEWVKKMPLHRKLFIGILTFPFNLMSVSRK